MNFIAFFLASTKRWAVLKSCLPPGSKNLLQLSDTRWEAHAKATTAVCENFAYITEALTHICDDNNEKGDTRLHARNLLQKLEELEFVFMLHLWTGLLQQFHKVSTALQSAEISLTTCANLYSALEQFLSTERKNFDKIEKKAKTALLGVEYKSIHQRRTVRTQTRIDDDSITATADALETSSARDKCRIKSFIPVIDALRSHLSRRATVYKRVAENFSFLIDLHASKEEILRNVTNLAKEFPIDVDLCLVDELLNFYLYVKKAHGNKASFSHVDN